MATTWKPEWDELLGKEPDNALAKRLGIPRTVVRYQRRKRSIPLVRMQSVVAPWDPEWDKRLGTVPAPLLAKEFGVTVGRVRKRCRELGVRPPRIGPASRWKPEWDALLGTIIDSELAKQFDVSYGTIALHRRRLGIKARGHSDLKWKPEWDVLLGTMPDEKLAGKLGLNTLTVGIHRRKAKIKCHRKMTSKAEAATALSDDELYRGTLKDLSKRLGCNPMLVMKERRRRGIRPLYVRRMTDPAVMFRAAVAGMLVMEPRPTSAEIGRRLKLTRERVRQIVKDVQAMLLIPFEEDKKAEGVADVHAAQA